MGCHHCSFCESCFASYREYIEHFRVNGKLIFSFCFGQKRARNP